MKTFLFIALIACLAACSRHTLASKSVVEAATVTAAKLTDTSSILHVSTTSQTSYYGDTLAASMWFGNDTAAVQIDSVETGGMSIKIKLQPVPGGYKARINAVAKPVTVDKTSKDSLAQHKGIDSSGHEKQRLKITTKTRDVETTGIPWPWIIAAAVFVLAVFCWFHFSLKKYL